MDIKIIGDLPEYVTLSKECIDFLQHPRLKIKFEDLSGVYSFFEFLCFKPIINNLQDYYKKKIDENDEKGESVQKKILRLFKEKKFKLITEKNLASACRKFISRYLVSTRKDTDYNEKMDLSSNLARYEFWPKEVIEDDDKFNNEISILKTIGLTTGQCYELYNLMGGDETDELNGIKIKEEKEEEVEDDYDDEDGGRIRRKNNEGKKKRVY